MSTMSTNLNLELQAPGERASLTVLNENLGKIDEFAGEQMLNTLDNVASKSALESALASFGANLGAEIRDIAVTFTAADGIFTATKYIGSIRRLYSDSVRYRVTLYENNSNKVCDGFYNGTAWTWKQLATVEDHIQKGNVAAASSVALTITRPCFVSVGRASTSAASTTAFIDNWGITYLSNNTQNFTISISDNTLTISNLSGGYCSYIVIC